MRVATGQRGGFTLIEVLVVIAIIAILTSLTAAGIFQVIESQRQSNTETTLRTVNKIFQQQMKAVLEKANKETIPPNVLNLMAGGDMKRARVIWKKLRLKQEFPMTFAEAREPYKDYAGNYLDMNPPPNPPPNFLYVLTKTELPSLYDKAIPAAPATVNTAAQPFLESSTCMLLALKQSRGGAPTLSADQLGTNAVDVNGDGLKEIVDGWGNPVAFFRFPTGSPMPNFDELDGMNPATTAASPAFRFRDPIDPEGTLIARNWNMVQLDMMGNPVLDPSNGHQLPNAQVQWFERLCHALHDPNLVAYQPWPRYQFPVLASSGRNGKWGLNSTFNLLPGSVFNPDLSSDQTPGKAADGDDNLYTHRLKLDQRGD